MLAQWVSMSIGGILSAAMAARSIAKTKSAGKSRSAIQEHFKNPEVPFAFGLLFADAILVSLIIAYVPCKDRTPFPFYVYFVKYTSHK